MIDFKDAELLSVLPENLLQQETQALSAALKEGLCFLQHYARAAPLYAAVEELTDEALNLLAVELRAQYYEPNAARSVREGIVKQTVAWYLRGGTGSVLTEYLKTLFQGGTLQEWYTYDGEPFFFKAIVELALNDVIEVGDGEKIIDRINTYKNVRSWLEALEFNIKAAYEVPISYDNAIHFQSSFHPRYNLSFLKLDHTWGLNNGRKLNGYDSEDYLDFYPVQIQMQAEAREDIQTEERIRFICENQEEIEVANAIGIQTQAMQEIRTETQLYIQTDVCVPIEIHTGLEIKTEANQEILTGEQLHIQTLAAAEIRTEEQLTMQTKAAYQIDTASYMTKMNQTDAMWSLNGSRKLDGGRYVL